MKKISIICITLLLCAISSYSQELTDSITILKTPMGYQFYHQETRKSVKKIKNIMKTDAEAYKIMKSANSSYIWANIFASVGGFMVGWEIGTALGGGESNWAVAAAGAGLVVVSIPFSSKFKKQSELAVKKYNSGIATSLYKPKPELRLAFTGNGVGLNLRF